MPCTFPGLSQITRWSFTLAHGISPSLATIDVVPQGPLPAGVGDLVIPTTSGPVVFRDCAIDRASIRRSAEGWIVSVGLHDRRWRWQYGSITGWYNIPAADGQVEPATSQSPRQLAARLLTALGETGFVVDGLPEGPRPEVCWDHASPAVELDRLCELLGCRVVLGLDNRIALCRVGVGAPLPALGVERRWTVGVDPPVRPGEIEVVGSPTLFQTRFRLEAVGEERNGALVPIESLSYRPAAGWGSAPPLFGNVTSLADRQRAQRSVFRWYRIRCTAPDNSDGVFRIPGCDVAVSALWQLLPLRPGLLQVETNAGGFPQPRSAVVEGRWYPGGADGQNHSESRRLARGWRLDRQRGVIELDEPLVLRDASQRCEPAELYLTVAHAVRRSDDRQPVRYLRRRPVAGSPPGAGVWSVRRDELQELVLGAPLTESGGPTQNSATPQRNTADLHLRADPLASALEQGLVPASTADVEYVGLQAVGVDGAIQQVQWSEGPEGAVTRASRNSEFATRLRPHAHRRLWRRLAQQAGPGTGSG